MGKHEFNDLKKLLFVGSFLLLTIQFITSDRWFGVSIGVMICLILVLLYLFTDGFFGSYLPGKHVDMYKMSVITAPALLVGMVPIIYFQTDWPLIGGLLIGLAVFVFGYFVCFVMEVSLLKALTEEISLRMFWAIWLICFLLIVGFLIGSVSLNDWVFHLTDGR